MSSRPRVASALDEEVRKALEEGIQWACDDLARCGLPPFSDEALVALRSTVYRVASWLVFEAVNASKGRLEDIVSAEDVLRTAASLLPNRHAENRRSFSAIELLFLGVSLTGVVTMCVAEKYPVWGIVATAAVGLAGMVSVAVRNHRGGRRRH